MRLVDWLFGFGSAYYDKVSPSGQADDRRVYDMRCEEMAGTAGRMYAIRSMMRSAEKRMRRDKRKYGEISDKDWQAYKKLGQDLVRAQDLYKEQKDTVNNYWRNLFDGYQY